jgi:dimethylargininase
MMFRNAILRTPAPSITDGLSTAGLGKPDYRRAMEQHALYIDALKHIGLEVKVLPQIEKYPDSTFIEDVALCTPYCAVISRPGAVSRRGEIAGFRNVLGEYYDKIEIIRLPGTVEAGDIMMAGNHYYIGISARTNNEGADQMIRILERYGMTGSKIIIKKMLHLKSGISYLENNTMLMCSEFAKNEDFKKYKTIMVDNDELYAANSLWINGKVLIADGFPKTREKVEKAGYETITIDVSEFRKIDGGLSCLSLRF